MNQSRNWLRRIGIAAGLAALVAASFFGSWFARNRLFRTPMPRALWTENDLPKLPERSANGWWFLHETCKKLPSLDLSPQLRALQLTEDRCLADQLDSSKSELASFLESERTQDWLMAYDTALAMAAFSDSCEPKVQLDCRIIPVFKAHQAYELKILDLAMHTNWDSSFSSLAKLIRSDSLLLASTRGIFSHVVAVSSVKKSLHLAETLLACFGKLPKTPSSPVISSVTRAAFTDAIDRVNPDEVSAKRAVVGEYLDAVDTLPSLSSGRESRSHSLIVNWAYDPGDSLERVNATFARLGDYAVDPLHQDPPSDLDPGTSWFWWWYNPVGKLAIFSQTSLSEQIRKAAEERSEIMKKREACKNALRSLAALSD